MRVSLHLCNQLPPVLCDFSPSSSSVSWVGDPLRNRGHNHPGDYTLDGLFDEGDHNSHHNRHSRCRLDAFFCMDVDDGLVYAAGRSHSRHNSHHLLL